MQIKKILNAILMSCSILGMANSSENHVEQIVIEHIENHNYYIYNSNNNRELIEDIEEELYDSELNRLTDGCISANNIYERENETVFDGFHVHEPCNLFLINNSVSPHTFTINIENSNVKLSEVIVHNTLTINLKINKHGAITIENLELKDNAQFIQNGNITLKNVKTYSH